MTTVSSTIANHIKPTDSIVILTGAGISKESGLDTFRCADGIWAKVDLEDVATPQGFARDPNLVHRFYNDRRRGLLDPAIQPNAAHTALAELERRWKGELLLVTQNIDDLHERAGSKTLIHMHGELRKVFCVHCRTVETWDGDLSVHDICPTCARKGSMRPDVVWFGEMPYQMDRIYQALGACDLFVSIGTSGNVYPAAGFVAEARGAGAHTVELNLEPSLGASHFAEAVNGPATEVVPAFVAELLRL
ncbi:Sir2 family NAD+-dependent deacetylase [Azospirillum canadense]|uniref:Sir2 family NAD+-dependent deacetylase n=1 Tax=Azospirillum canadense TaxID=403962 RepID=UPI002226207F|nr:Sir2 family NAD+-dependent deacetylase [Azospirillum canadense]MCW2238204.1 NAD-dependent deacetylase [Azospirillum canadense]